VSTGPRTIFSSTRWLLNMGHYAPSWNLSPNTSCNSAVSQKNVNLPVWMLVTPQQRLEFGFRWAAGGLCWKLCSEIYCARYRLNFLACLTWLFFNFITCLSNGSYVRHKYLRSCSILTQSGFSRYNSYLDSTKFVFKFQSLYSLVMQVES